MREYLENRSILSPTFSIPTKLACRSRAENPCSKSCRGLKRLVYILIGNILCNVFQRASQCVA